MVAASSRLTPDECIGLCESRPVWKCPREKKDKTIHNTVTYVFVTSQTAGATNIMLHSMLRPLRTDTSETSTSSRRHRYRYTHSSCSLQMLQMLRRSVPIYRHSVRFDCVPQ